MNEKRQDICTTSKGLKLQQGRFRLDIRKKFLYRKSCEALEQAAQGSGGVIVPGGVQKACKYGTSGHGLVGMVVMGQWLNLMILKVFSNRNDSMILFYDSMWTKTSV